MTAGRMQIQTKSAQNQSNTSAYLGVRGEPWSPMHPKAAEMRLGLKDQYRDFRAWRKFAWRDVLKALTTLLMVGVIVRGTFRALRIPSI